MPQFSFDHFTMNMPEWAKHYKWLSAHVGRVYSDPDKENVWAEDENTLDVMTRHKDKLLYNKVHLIDRKTGEDIFATDVYLPAYNQDYIESNMDHYDVGASNTRQTMYIRLTFQLGDESFKLDYHIKSSGTFASSFHDFITDMDVIEDTLKDVADQNRPIEETGIEHSEDNDDAGSPAYAVIIVSEYGRPDVVELSQSEIVKSLTGIEVYDFSQTITNNI